MVSRVMDNRKEPRWISVLVNAEDHKELTIRAIDEGTTLAELVKNIISEFLRKEVGMKR